MPIKFSCPSCSAEIKASDDFAGKRAKCKTCKTIVVVPTKSEPQGGSSPREAASSGAASASRRRDRDAASSSSSSSTTPAPSQGAKKPKKIQFSCQNCRTKITASIDFAGKRAKCKSCSAVVQVPALPASHSGDGTRASPKSQAAASKPKTTARSASASSNSDGKIQFLCPDCQAKITAGPEFAGKRAKCKTCKSVVTVPGAPQTPQPLEPVGLQPAPLQPLQPAAPANPPLQSLEPLQSVDPQLAPLQPLQPVDNQAVPLQPVQPLQPIDTSTAPLQPMPPVSAEMAPLQPLQPVAGGAALTPLGGGDLGVAPLGGGADDLFGDLGSAPASSNPYAAPLPAQPAKPTTSRGGAGGGFGTVAHGIQLIYWGLALGLLVAALGVCQIGIAFVSLGMSVIMLFWLSQAAYLASVISLVGKFLCLGIPGRTGAKVYIVISVTLEISAMVLGLMKVPNLAVPLIISLCGLGAWVLFLLFIRKTASFIRRNDLADAAWSQIMFGIGMMVATVAFALITVAVILAGNLGLLGVWAIATRVFVLAAIIAAIVWLVNYLRLLGDMREALFRMA